MFETFMTFPYKIIYLFLEEMFSLVMAKDFKIFEKVEIFQIKYTLCPLFYFLNVKNWFAPCIFFCISLITMCAF